MKSEMEGEIVDILPERQVGTKGFSVREFRVREHVDGEPAKYENVLPFVVKHGPNDRYNDLEQLKTLAVGDVVKFAFAPRGRLWTSQKGETRCFVDLAVTGKISVTRRAVPAEALPNPASPADGDVPAASEAEDLPF